MLALLLALTLPAPQDGTIAPDRATYEDLVRCGGVYRASAVEGETAGGAQALVAQANAVATGFQHLAYLYGAPLGVGREATDAALQEAFETARAPVMLARTLGALERARRQLATEQEICSVILQRVSGTS